MTETYRLRVVLTNAATAVLLATLVLFFGAGALALVGLLCSLGALAMAVARPVVIGRHVDEGEGGR